MAKSVNITDVLWRVAAHGTGTVFHLPPVLDGSWRPQPNAVQGGIGEPSMITHGPKGIVEAPLCGGRKGSFIQWSALDGYWTLEDFGRLVLRWSAGFCKNCIKRYEKFYGVTVNPVPRKRFTDKDRVQNLFFDPNSPNQPHISSPFPAGGCVQGPVSSSGTAIVAQVAQVAQGPSITRAEAIDLAEKIKKHVLANRCSIDEGIEAVATAEDVDLGLASRAFYKYTSPVLITALTFGDDGE
jgi:hypothetical protein